MKPEASVMGADTSTDAIVVDALRKTYGGRSSLFGRATHAVHAVKGVSFTLREGETLALVGESGSGKSTIARMLVGLETPSGGGVLIGGEDAAALRARGPRAFGRRIQYVFQDPIASLNPRKTIGDILAVPLRLLCGLPAAQRAARSKALLDAVRLPATILDRYPHELSGGQAQRIAIARALAAQARILVLDEPVSALDVSVQAQVLLLLEQLKQEFGLSYLFISHDLAVVEAIADRVGVLYLGELVELEDCATLFSSARHPYTRELLASAPRLDRNLEGR